MEAVDYRLPTLSLPADYLLWCVVTTRGLRYVHVFVLFWLPCAARQ